VTTQPGVEKVLLAFADTEVLDASLSACFFVRYTEHTIPDRLKLLAELQGIRNRGWPSTTKSTRTACAAWPPRCGIGGARSSPP